MSPQLTQGNEKLLSSPRRGDTRLAQDKSAGADAVLGTRANRTMRPVGALRVASAAGFRLWGRRGKISEDLSPRGVFRIDGSKPPTRISQSPDRRRGAYAGNRRRAQPCTRVACPRRRHSPRRGSARVRIRLLASARSAALTGITASAAPPKTPPPQAYSAHPLHSAMPA